MKKFSLFLSVAFLIFIIPNQSAKADPLLMHAKFSPGGYSITLWMDEENQMSGALARTLEIKYCDGTSARRSSWRFIPPIGSNGLTHSFEKPMERVVVFWTGVDQDYSHEASFRRDCNDPASPNSFFCNVVSVDNNLHRGESGEVQFISQRDLYRAWLQLGSAHEMVKLLSLKYSPSTREWSGSFDAAGILVGEYEDVSLIVQDEFERQAKCRVGDLTILDWGE